MRGRFVHQPDGSAALQPYGRRPGEVIYSISRQRLNAALLDAALRLPGVEAKFEHRLTEPDFGDEIARFEDLRSGREIRVPMRPLLAADGAGSLMRRRMAAAGLIEARESDLEHGYKELTIPAGPRGAYRMEREALHIWPRGGYMLIALPNERRQLHGHPVPARARPLELREPELTAGRGPVPHRELSGRTSAHAGLRGRIRASSRRASWARCTPDGWHVRRRRRAHRRCRACHRSLPRAGDELLLRGLRGVRCLRWAASNPGKPYSRSSMRAASRIPTRSRKWRWRITWKCGNAWRTPAS